VVPAFVGATTVDLPIACSFDFNVAATKYFHGVQSGEIPAAFLFSGTVFYEAAAGGLQAVQIPWDREASFRVPLELWKEMMELYYPQSVWLSLRDDVFERLRDYKVRNGLPTYEAALESMLGTAAEGVGR
jgi:hypothetical protein